MFCQVELFQTMNELEIESRRLCMLCLEMNLACGFHISSSDFLIFLSAAWEM